MDVIVINLARATERRTVMEQQLAGFGMQGKFLTATDGRTLSDAEKNSVDHNVRRSISLYPLSNNEIGCWLSHKRAMEQLIASGAPMAAIIEDDARLFPEFATVLKAIEELPFSFDVIDLHRKFKRQEIFIPLRQLTPQNKLGRIGYTHMGAIGYVISRQGAEKFLNSVTRLGHAVDKEMHRYWANGLDLFGLEHPVAEQQDNGYSYIDETRGQDRPTARVEYPDARSLHWKIRRRWVQIKDSFQKRMAFRQQCATDKAKTWN